jgi:ribonuclease P protein component
MFVQDEYVRIYFAFTETFEVAVSHQFAFSVPKKIFPKASDRNYIKRLMREVVRKNKAQLTETFKQKSGSFFIACKTPTQPDYALIENSIIKLFAKVVHRQ